MTRIRPHRFGEVFQFDSKMHGTHPQQQAIRDALTPSYGSKFHALLQNFDRYYNRVYQRSFVNLEIKDFGKDIFRLAVAGAASIAFSDKLAPTPLKDIARHEFGHVLDNTDYLIQSDRDFFMSALGIVPDWNQCRETWADAVRDWINGTSWQSLDGILLRGR